MTKSLISLIAIALGLNEGLAFTSFATPRHRVLHGQQWAPAAEKEKNIRCATSLDMCICINCARVTNCSAYHFVEQQHLQPHINKNPTWEPRNGSPTIQVHVRQEENAESELGKMWDEHQDQTRQAEEVAGVRDGAGEALFGEKKYDISGATSYEYDVIECEDFVEEKNAWVKNMPEEIRIANPDFVPT